MKKLLLLIFLASQSLLMAQREVITDKLTTKHLKFKGIEITDLSLDGTMSNPSDLKLPTQLAVRKYVDSTTLFDLSFKNNKVFLKQKKTGITDSIDLSNLVTSSSFRGSYNASSGALPTTGGSGSGGSIRSGDYWVISTGGTLPSGVLPTNVVVAGNLLIATNTPPSTSGHWSTVQSSSASYSPGVGIIFNGNEIRAIDTSKTNELQTLIRVGDYLKLSQINDSILVLNTTVKSLVNGQGTQVVNTNGVVGVNIGSSSFIGQPIFSSHRHLRSDTNTIFINRTVQNVNSYPFTLISSPQNGGNRYHTGLRFWNALTSTSSFSPSYITSGAAGFYHQHDSSFAIRLGKITSKRASVFFNENVFSYKIRSNSDSTSYLFYKDSITLSNYNSSRSDIGNPINILSTSSNGTIRSYPISKYGFNNALAGHGLRFYNNKIHLGGTWTNKASIDSVRYINYPERKGSLVFQNTTYNAPPQGSNYFTPIMIRGKDDYHDLDGLKGSQILFNNLNENLTDSVENRITSDTKSLALRANSLVEITSEDNTRVSVGHEQFGFTQGFQINLNDPVTGAPGNFLNYSRLRSTGASDGSLVITDYDFPRNDIGKPRNITSFSTDGTLQVHRINEIKDSLSYAANEIAFTPIAFTSVNAAVTGVNVQEAFNSVSQSLATVNSPPVYISIPLFKPTENITMGTLYWCTLHPSLNGRIVNAQVVCNSCVTGGLNIEILSSGGGANLSLSAGIPSTGQMAITNPIYNYIEVRVNSLLGSGPWRGLSLMLQIQ